MKSIQNVSIDIETYSDIPLTECGVYKYVDSPNFTILLFAYAIDDEPVLVVDIAKGEKIPKKIKKLLFDTSIIKTAFNAQFERVCLSKHFNRIINPESWQCTMVRALTLGIPGSLDTVSKSLGFTEDKQKLFTGKNLIRLFSIPRKIKTEDNQVSMLQDKMRLLPEDLPDEWEQFKEYCIRDVEVERRIRKKLESYQITDEELRMWYLDQMINDYGVRLDLDLAKHAIHIDEQYTAELVDNYKKLGLKNPKSVTELKNWLSPKLGYNVRAVTKETIPDLISQANEKKLPEVKKALKIRREISKTSISKYTKMEDVICHDGRARGLLQFYGSRTGRWAGRLIQVQNLPQNKIKDLDLARQVVSDGDLELLEMIYPSVPVVLSQLIRTAFTPSEGHRFIVADFSAIEARVIAWLAGEKWRMDVFRTHGKIYEASAAQMFQVPIESVTKGSALRQKGKVAELALGYQGAAGALVQMGALKMGLEEGDLPGLVSQWRMSNPKIVKLWANVENAAIEAVTERKIVELHKGLKLIYEPGILFIQLPSGRSLAYMKPEVIDHDRFAGRVKLTFENTDLNYNKVREDTYGGKLTENIIQAIARDCLRDAMLRLDKAGYKIAFHVHDEVILDMPIGEGSLKEAIDIMEKPLSWAPDLPLRADGYECADYYRKD